MTILVNIYVGDGTVTVVHGGVEIGQGINTKVRCYIVFICCKALF